MAAAGIPDILVTNQVVEERKIASAQSSRARSLVPRFERPFYALFEPSVRGQITQKPSLGGLGLMLAVIFYALPAQAGRPAIIVFDGAAPI
jgi:hypothetical protein